MEPDITISSIVFIVMLIVPGVFFKRFYFRGQFTKQFTSGLFADRLITSIFWGLLVQLITFLIYNKFLDLSYDNIKKPVSAVFTNLGNNTMPDITNESLTYLLAYIFTSIIISAVFGSLAHGFIRFFKIDSKFEVFRFANHWNYYFRGDSMDFGEFKSRKTGKVLSTLIDIVMEDGSGGTKMFSGFLTQYQISSDTGELEILCITDASRYSKSNQALRPVAGDCLIIPYKKVIDMNIRYNVRVEDSNLYVKLAQAVIGLFSGLSFLFLLIYPWFLDVSFWRIAVGILTSLGGWVLIIALLNHLFKVPNSTQSSLDARGIFGIIGILIALVVCSLWLFNLIGSFQILVSHPFSGN